MSSLFILISSLGHSELSRFAPFFFEMIGEQQFERRESSNYKNEYYYKCIMDNISFFLSENDEDYIEHFFLEIKSGSGPKEELESILMRNIIPRFDKSIVKFAQLHNYGKFDEIRTELNE